MKLCKVEPWVKVRAEKIEDGFGVKSHLEGIDIAATERDFYRQSRIVRIERIKRKEEISNKIGGEKK